MPKFHVFLSHKSSDKPAMRALKGALAKQGLNCWLDEEQLRPGLPWQDLLQQGIKDSGSVAADGLGPWEDEEMQAALRLAVKDHRPASPSCSPGRRRNPSCPFSWTTAPGWTFGTGSPPGASPIWYGARPARNRVS